MSNIRVRSLLLSLTLFSLLAVPALLRAQNFDDPETTNYGLEEVRTIKIGQSTDVKDTIAQVINIALGFLGVIAVIIIIYAGFKWMTAGGNEESVTEARKMILQAVIGLVIIFSAWIISTFVFDRLRDVTNV